jgi:ketosteroid isomerase-like protein
MSDRDRNRALVEKAFDAFARRDVEAINALLDPEIKVMISDQLGQSGSWSGIDGFWESLAGWLEAFDEDYRTEVLAIDTPDDAHVIVEARQMGRGRASGVPVELVTYFMFEIRDGRATRYELHASREDAEAAIASGA